jgi:NAD-reducing hydrogenase small subunit
MSFLDLDERLIELAALANVVFTPIADTKIFPDNVDVTLVEGAIANTDHVEMLLHVRQRTRILAALGDCAITGNVTALRNVYPVEAVLNRSYGVSSPDDGILPKLTRRVAPLHHLVQVDAYIPGCPPDAQRIWQSLIALIGDQPVRSADAPPPRFG